MKVGLSYFCLAYWTLRQHPILGKSKAVEKSLRNGLWQKPNHVAAWIRTRFGVVKNIWVPNGEKVNQKHFDYMICYLRCFFQNTLGDFSFAFHFPKSGVNVPSPYHAKVRQLFQCRESSGWTVA